MEHILSINLMHRPLSVMAFDTDSDCPPIDTLHIDILLIAFHPDFGNMGPEPAEYRTSRWA